MRVMFIGTLAAALLLVTEGMQAQQASACGVKLTLKAKQKKPKQTAAKKKRKKVDAKEAERRRVRAKRERRPVRSGAGDDTRKARTPNDQNRRPKSSGGMARDRGGSNETGSAPERNTVAKKAPSEPKAAPTKKPTRAEKPEPRKKPEKAKKARVAASKRSKASPAREPEKRRKPASPASPISVEVYFNLASSSLDAQTRSSLAKVVSWLEDNPQGRVVVAGYTDARGPADFNRRLSRKRARSVKRYLVSEAGVAARRIRVVGHGEANLAYPANSPKNRRVVVKNQ